MIMSFKVIGTGTCTVLALKYTKGDSVDRKFESSDRPVAFFGPSGLIDSLTRIIFLELHIAPPLKEKYTFCENNPMSHMMYRV